MPRRPPYWGGTAVWRQHWDRAGQRVSCVKYNWKLLHTIWPGYVTTLVAYSCFHTPTFILPIVHTLQPSSLSGLAGDGHRHGTMDICLLDTEIPTTQLSPCAGRWSTKTWLCLPGRGWRDRRAPGWRPKPRYRWATVCMSVSMCNACVFVIITNFVTLHSEGEEVILSA